MGRPGSNTGQVHSTMTHNPYSASGGCGEAHTPVRPMFKRTNNRWHKDVLESRMMTTEEIDAWYSLRTLTPAEVDALGREKDKLSFTPAERLEQVAYTPPSQTSRH